MLESSVKMRVIPVIVFILCILIDPALARLVAHGSFTAAGGQTTVTKVRYANLQSHLTVENSTII